MKSTYVGRGEIAHMIAQIQSSSPLLERLAPAVRSPEQVKLEKAEGALQKATGPNPIDDASRAFGWRVSHSPQTMAAKALPSKQK